MKEVKWMFAFSKEQFADCCAICYFDVKAYQQGMSFDAYIKHAFDENRSHDPLYMQLKEYCQQMDVSCFSHLKLMNYVNENNQNGLVFYHFEDDDRCYLVYRGSESLDGENRACGWEDWEDNLEIFLGVTHQQLRAVKYFNELKTTKPITLLGHSKGGNLALFLSVVCSEERFEHIEQVMVFNAPGLNQDTMSNYEMRIKSKAFQEKIYCYENEADPVSSMFHHVKEPILLMTSSNEKGIKGAYDSHQLWSFQKENGSFVETDHKSLLASVADLISNQMMESLDQETKEKMIAHLMKYVQSDYPIEQMYHVMLYHIGQYADLFDENEEITSIEFETLLEKMHLGLKKSLEEAVHQSKKKVESWMNKNE